MADLNNKLINFNVLSHYDEKIKEYIEDQQAVTSVNSKTGAVTLTASDVDALPDDIAITKGTGTSAVKLNSSSEASGGYALAEGRLTKATNTSAHAEGYGSIAGTSDAEPTYSPHAGDDEAPNSKEGYFSHAEGNGTWAKGVGSHAEGYCSRATSHYTHAEGYMTRANGRYSHTEGADTRTVSGAKGAHAEGIGSGAQGIAAHAEGKDTKAIGDYSHSGGLGTTTNNEAQTAIGKYNADNANALLIVGRGSSDTVRANAFEAGYDSTNGDFIKVGTEILTASKLAAMKNPADLTFGSKTYDGQTAMTITAADLGLSGAMKFLGTTSTAIIDGSPTRTITINGSSITVSAGNVVLYGGYEYVWTGGTWEQLGQEGSFKTKQDAVSSPTTSGSTTAFIDTISQDANGKITATKKNVSFPVTSVNGQTGAVTISIPNEVQIGSGTMGIGVVLQVDPSDNSVATSVINTVKAYIDDEVEALENKIDNNQSIEFATTEEIKALTDVCSATIVQYCNWLWGEGDYGVAGKYSINTPITSRSQINSLPEFDTMLSFKKTDVLYIATWSWDPNNSYSISETSGCTVEEMESINDDEAAQEGYYVLKITPTSNKARIRLEYSE